MASIKTKFTVGLFIAVGLAITIIAIIWLGMSKYLEKGQLYVAYFDESVQGLDRDATVKYRGVPVGRVRSVGVAPDGTLVQVVMRIEADLEPEREKEIVGDIVAQLKSIGITGIMFLELDRKREGDPEFIPKLTFEPPYPVIATRPSGIKMFLEGVDEILNQLKAMDAKGLTDSVKATFEKIDQTVDDIQPRELSVDIRSTLNHINRILAETQVARMVGQIDRLAQSVEVLIGAAHDTIKRFDNILASNEKDINAAVGEVHRLIQSADNTLIQLNRIMSSNKEELNEAVLGFNRSVHNLEKLLSQGRRLIKQGDSTLYELQPRLLVVMQGLETTVENLKSFSENIAEQPSRLLFGQPPEARPVEPD